MPAERRADARRGSPCGNCRSWHDALYGWGTMLVAEAEVRTVVPRGTDIEQQWAQVRGALRAELGDTAFLTWLKPLDVAYMDGDRVVIAVPTQFMRDWVVAHYADRIRSIWTTINPGVRSIALNVAASAAGPVPSEPVALPQRAIRAGADAGREQRPLDAGRAGGAARPPLHLRDL